MVCPNCGKELLIDPVVLRNVECYGNPKKAATRCCGTGVVVQPVTTYRVTPYHGGVMEDDWGNPFKHVEATS